MEKYRVIEKTFRESTFAISFGGGFLFFSLDDESR